MDSDEVVRELFAAFGRRDAPAALRYCDEQIEFWLQATAERAGRQEPYRGHEGIKQYVEDVARIWDELEVQPGELRVAGAGVVAFGVAHGRIGEELLTLPVIWVFRVRNEKVVFARAVRSVGEAKRELHGQARRKPA